MMLFRTGACVYLGLLAVCAQAAGTGGPPGHLVPDSGDTPRIPPLVDGPPGPGKRVRVTPPEYAGTNVFHTLYLPPEWRGNGPRLSIIFEYTGNYFPAAGSTGKNEDAALGYGLSGGRYIWVSLPYVSADHKRNAVTWWGDVEATVEYARVNVPRIIREFHADPSAVFLCGFSRGAIAVDYIGLHDDEVARLWTAFITHDHFDGVREWKNTAWGAPLETYRRQAAERLRRVGDRPYLVCRNGGAAEIARFVRSVLPYTGNFTFLDVDAVEALGTFPNAFAKAAHTDRWLLKPSRFRTAAWKWMNGVADVRFDVVRALDWKEVFHDPCTGDWRRRWTLDGLKATVRTGPEGMEFRAGPVRKSDPDHAVLWTRRVFEGDIRIEYEYTKLDDATEAVTILYLLASGSGAPGFDRDIAKWADKRTIPAMAMYFRHMNLYHVSYAAYPWRNTDPANDYVRARRYLPERREGLKGTGFLPDFTRTGLFRKGVPCRITAIRYGDDLFFRATDGERELVCRWKTGRFPPVREGRIGFRHMWTRAARYRDVRIFVRPGSDRRNDR